MPLHRLHPRGVLHLQPHSGERRAALEANAGVDGVQDAWARGKFGAVMVWAQLGVVMWGGGGLVVVLCGDRYMAIFVCDAYR